MAKPMTRTGSGLSLLGDRVLVVPSETHNVRQGEQESDDSNLVDLTGTGESPMNFFHDLKLHVRGSGWRGYNKVVGQPVFYSGYTDDITRAVMANVMLKDKLQDLAVRRVQTERAQDLYGVSRVATQKSDLRLQQIVEELRERAQVMLNDLICKMESKIFIRGAYYAVTSLLTQAYHQGVTFPVC